MMTISNYTGLPQIMASVPFENHCYLPNYDEQNDTAI